MNQRQKGQVLLVALLALGVFSTLMLKFFYVGQINYQALRQRYALDAATYSAALLQAQMLNYAAYMNRAYAGHQIAMAHLVTLASWAEFAQTQAQRVQMANPPASLISMMFGPQYGLSYQASLPAQSSGVAENQLKALFAQHQKFSALVFEPHSQVIYADIPAQREARIRSVLYDNYPELALQQQPQLMQLEITDDNWHEVLGWHASAGWQPWLKELLAHYDFLKPRHKTAKNNWLVQARCPHKRHELRRRGATVLTSEGHWQAEDTLSFHALRSNRWIGCYHREYAMGWAWVQGQTDNTTLEEYESAPDNFSQQDFWRWVQEHTQWDITDGSANGIAHAWARRDQTVWPSQGLHNFLITRASNPEFRFKTRLALQYSAGAQLVHSQSEAKNSYEEPPSQTGHAAQKATLFQPYWQAALANSEWEQRLQQLLGER
ncbi:hypothetical protein ACBP46_06510 [Paenalcaligenes hominis]|uniref:hypothetical protein n=1 Tax=Paenalcaligenes hominis TaxID=643674 RepID=UPI003525D06B